MIKNGVEIASLFEWIFLFSKGLAISHCGTLKSKYHNVKLLSVSCVETFSCEPNLFMI